MKLAVLGSPISHSLSPKIHGAAYQALGLPAEYGSHEVSESIFLDFMETHPPSKWRGFSLTMPLKEIALSVCQEVEEVARSIGAINTLVSNEKGWIGYNTDVAGFSYLFAQMELNEIAILGAGGTAKAALSALASLGKSAKVFRRDSKRDESLKRISAEVEIMDWRDVSEAFEATLLVNTLPLTAFEQPELRNNPRGKVMDALYHPWPTPLMVTAEERVLFTGKDLLVAQALSQIEIFSGRTIDKPRYFKELRALI
ncbi:MAG: shikimate dehydrogenase family protein [Actinomycetota bacterium]